MAPFKLKFRKSGSGSRGPSQEEYDPQADEALLSVSNENIGASSSTIDSADCSSLGNERKHLLPNKNSEVMKLGYLNPTIPNTPPPSYEHVLEENSSNGMVDSSIESFNVDESKLSDECLLQSATSNSTLNQQEDSSIDDTEENQNDCAPPDYSSENNDNTIEDEDESDNDLSCSTYSEQYTSIPDPKFISNKSTKKMYKAVAKEMGITCKMSDQCRCLDCQSNYFGCDYDYTEQNSDGGLGAVNAVFINEVMHGTACTIL